ncbi:hypothetical protein [Arachidicoccus ginsenosidivorans]|nr:hypothetical protein [Arachidicoccus ginsenosidivorans]
MANDSLSTVLFNETGVVEPNTYTETYIGEFTNDGYNWCFHTQGYARW